MCGVKMHPITTFFPVLFCKSSVCWNPVIYFALNSQASRKDIQYTTVPLLSNTSRHFFSFAPHFHPMRSSEAPVRRVAAAQRTTAFPWLEAASLAAVAAGPPPAGTETKRLSRVRGRRIRRGRREGSRWRWPKRSRGKGTRNGGGREKRRRRRNQRRRRRR